ncbi:MAG: hypothetical protein ACOYOL_09510 [Chthoniobacterales bacterium]|jgi:hypothetical protein
MKPLVPILLAAMAAPIFSGCQSHDPYQDPMYTLQRDLRHRNESWDNRQERRSMRRDARDDRYQAWFNSVME